MISPRCFEEAWIREQAAALKARDLRTLEKNILALELVSRLQRLGLDFIFKGGTSLALFFDPVRRLSIDVDILSLESTERLKAVLDQATTDIPPFIGYEHQERRDREAPPTVHFRIPYSSALDLGGVHSIQLDVITAESPYAATEAKVVRASFFEIEEEVQVRVPTADCLLADKLACFAPSTIGYLYQPIVVSTGAPGDPRPMKVVKHLFDVGELSIIAGNLNDAVQTYRAVHAKQLRWGEMSAPSIKHSMTPRTPPSGFAAGISGRRKPMRRSTSSATASAHSTVTFSNNPSRLRNPVSPLAAPPWSRNSSGRVKRNLTSRRSSPPRSISTPSVMPIWTLRGPT